MRRRVGILGGTFDPPHLGHLLAASAAFEKLELDSLNFIPAANPPHKSGVETPGEVRLEMLQAAVQDDPRFGIDSIELERGGRSYTVDTLRALRAAAPDDQWILLLGADQFNALSSWKEPEAIQEIAQIAVFARAGESPVRDGPYNAVAIEIPRIDISSTEIRRRVAEGLSIRFYVAEATRKIIRSHRLYTD